MAPFVMRGVCAALSLLAFLARARRWPMLLVLIGGVLALTPGPATPAAAIGNPPNKPAARLQIVVTSVKIHDDREGLLSGDGEMLMYVGIWRCTNGLPLCESASPQGVPDGLPNSVSTMAEPLARTGIFIYGGTGDTVTLGDVVPGGGEMWGVGTSEDFGFPVYPDQNYTVQFDMTESDEVNVWDFDSDEYMGYAYQRISLNDLALGTHTQRSIHPGGGPGDYSVTYEVRMVAAADLSPSFLKVEPVAGTTRSHVCIGVVNAGTVASDSMYVALKVDGVVPTGGRVDAATLGAGENGVSCVDVVLPASGQHTLTGVVDAVSNVNEYNELNNEIEYPYVAPNKTAGPDAAPTPTATPGGRVLEEGGKPDLAVASVEVNGQQPNGKSDCTEGKRSVSVVVKNDGAAVARKVAVQLAVDGGQAATKQVASVQPGEAEEVAFEDVRLKKGQQKLTATVDPKNAVDEGDDGNNDLSVTVTCTGRD
jgi:hypothetical protein